MKTVSTLFHFYSLCVKTLHSISILHLAWKLSPPCFSSTAYMWKLFPPYFSSPAYVWKLFPPYFSSPAYVWKLFPPYFCFTLCVKNIFTLFRLYSLCVKTVSTPFQLYSLHVWVFVSHKYGPNRYLKKTVVLLFESTIILTSCKCGSQRNYSVWSVLLSVCMKSNT